MLILLLGFAALFLAFSNGANDNFKGFATVWGSASLSYRRALLLATAATIAGGLASLLLAGALVEQFSGKGLVPDALASTPSFALAVAGAAAITVILATRLGFPVSTTHALVGGLIGAGVANSLGDLDFGTLGSSFILPLLTSPLLSAGISFGIYLAIRLRRPPGMGNEDGCICLVEDEASRRLSTGGAMVLRRHIGSHAPRLVIADAAACDDGPVPLARASIARLRDGAHMFSATTICFARGVNDTPKLAALLIGAGLFGGAYSAMAITAAMALGGLLLARRVAETMSLKINRLDPVQGIWANLTTAALVLGASRLGLPVSTTHVSVGSIVGIGAAAGTLDLSTVRNVLLSWLATLPLAAGIAYAIAGLTLIG